MFSDIQLPARPAEVVAENAGLPLYRLDPEGGGSSEEESYQDFMRKNAAILLEALSGGSQ
jgi:ABC-type Zn uptake system ZnuABC Zn-binding protein ZnuA